MNAAYDAIRQLLDELEPTRDAQDRFKESAFRVGHTLVLIQIAELRINRALLVVSAADQESLTMQRLERMEDSQRAEPLGRALNQLRARVEFSTFTFVAVDENRKPRLVPPARSPR